MTYTMGRHVKVCSAACDVCVGRCVQGSPVAVTSRVLGAVLLRSARVAVRGCVLG